MSVGKPYDLYATYSGKKPFSTWDIVAIILLIAIVVLCVFFVVGGSTGSYAEIYYNGELIKTVALDTNITFTMEDLAGSPTFTVKDNAIAITHIHCENQICVHTDFISHNNERIVCLPNKITVIVRGDDESFVVTGGANNG